MNFKYLKSFLLIQIFGSFNFLNAQNSYSFHITNGNYTELNNAKIIPWAEFDSLTDMFTLSDLDGETFQFYKTPFLFGGNKTIALESFGVVRIDNDTSIIIIDAAFTYLDSINKSSSISYSIEGTSGNYILKGQWKNLKIRNGKENNYVNFQIWVYQKSGVIEVHYGTSSLNNASGFNISNGPHAGMFFSKNDFTKCHEKLWITGSPTNLKPDTSKNYSFKAIKGIPNAGVILRFVPRFTNSIKSIPASGNNIHFFPNPVENGLIYLEKASNYKITDLTGRILLKGDLLSIVDVSSLSQGTYLLLLNEKLAMKFTIH